jgi:hypothetical protein
MQEWYAAVQQSGSGNCSAFYLARSTVHQVLPNTLQLRKQLLLPELGPVKQRPVLFIQGPDDGPNHLVLLDYVANKVFLFGTFGRNTDDTQYTSWAHHNLWEGIANGFRWVSEDKEPLALQLDWVQVCM